MSILICYVPKRCTASAFFHVKNIQYIVHEQSSDCFVVVLCRLKLLTADPDLWSLIQHDVTLAANTRYVPKYYTTTTMSLTLKMER